ncbi:histidine kinase [Scytonema hofmannii PCC 7110]|uniref:histidine kinase n=1 Tax=Scytonema hofmannii PCC 7110 TaxID=128403 RepID=A0A139WRK2_9CYAN|nr:GAF domain-containing protein [Scytonema hofmannii]KYC35066.1 histidine kinase [Scytonema hofmannii PCC 7110]
MTDLILVVDDDKITRLQMRQLLQQVGYRVAEATNGEQALAVYMEQQPDMVLLDAMMPIVDGFTCCTKLQALPGGAATPILMITALYDQVSVDKAFAAGATDYISKPIQWQVLRQRVRRVLESRRAMQELHQQSEQAQNREAQLRIALDAARMSPWEWDITHNKVTWSEHLKLLLRLNNIYENTTYEAFLERVHPQDRNFVDCSVKQVLQGGFDYDIEFRVIGYDGSLHWIASKGVVFRDSEGVALRMSGVDMDITKRKQAEESLEAYANRQALVAELSQMALAGLNLTTLMQETVTLVSHSLKVEYCNILELLPDSSILRLVAGVGWHPELVGQATVSAGSDSQAGHTLRSQEPTIVNDFLTETRFGKPQLPHDYFIVSSVSLLIHGKENPFGVLEVHTTRTRTFSKEDVYFLQAVTNMLATAIERQRFEDVLRGNEQRSQLFSDITLKIRQSLQIDEIIQTSVTEVQHLLQADRVLIFRLLPDGTGVVVQEAVVSGFISILGHNLEDPCFNEDYVQQYRQGRIGSMSDIEKVTITPCYLEFLQKLSVKANLIVPIIFKNKLWGLLIAHQCAHPREWTSWETELLQQLANQIGIAVAQAQLLEQETRQRQELARSNEELQQFAFIASHDLQEPLRKIKTFGERLKATCSDALTEQGQDYLERMQNATRRMQALIEDLLTLSRVTTRAKPFEQVDLAQVTQEVLSDLEIRILQTEALVEVGDLPTVQADPLQMRQLLQNLIGNALKFHYKDTPPIVKIYTQQHEAGHEQLIVEDNGIGFDEKYLDRIFNVFQRLHGRNEYEGTGMGLAIARKIVERHGWSITAYSQLGKGSKFIVSLAFL